MTTRDAETPDVTRARDLLARFAAAWAARDVAALLALLCPDAVYAASVGPEPGRTYRGHGEIADGLRAMFAHDGNVRVEPGEPVVFGDRAFSTWTYHIDEHTPTSRVEHGVDLWEFRDGRISLKDAYRKVAG